MLVAYLLLLKDFLIKILLNKDALTVNGKTISENNLSSKCWNDDVIRNFDDPLTKEGGIKF